MLKRPVPEYAPILRGFKAEKDCWFTYDETSAVWLGVKGPNALGQNPGIDFDCPVGTAVCAMAAGMVIKAGYESAKDPKQGLGRRVAQLIQQPGRDSWIATYGHLSLITIGLGVRVAEGEVIGLTGESGACDRPMLHVRLSDLRGQYQPMEFK
jgi:murein DD-endopeptidase MepM/ murein hydrolase activator NlpD